MSMVDGFPYKEEVGGSSPSAPTICDVIQFRCRHVASRLPAVAFENSGFIAEP